MNLNNKSKKIDLWLYLVKDRIIWESLCANDRKNKKRIGSIFQYFFVLYYFVHHPPLILE